MKKTYCVLKMECSACAMRLEGLEDEVAGVRSIRASYRKAEMEVDFASDTPDEAALLAAVKRMGYEAKEKTS